MKIAAFLAMALVWGLTWLAARSATDVAPPVFVAGVRLICACPFFVLWCLIARLRMGTPRVGRLLASSLLINTGCYSLLFWGVARTPTGLAAIVNLSLIPVFSMGVGALYGEERITRGRIAAVALGAVGLALLFSARGTTSPDERATAWGLAAIVVATLSYAWGAIVSKPLVREMPPTAVAAWQTAIGGAGLLLVSAAVESFDLARLGALAQGRAAAGMAFLVGAGSLIGFSVYLWLLREWGAFRAGLYAFVSPIVAVAVGVWIAGEPFGTREAAGMAIMLGATALVVRPERARAGPS